MKKTFFVFVVMAIMACSASAQDLEISSVKIDSIISTTSNSCTFSAHIVGLNKGGWVMAYFELEPNSYRDISDPVLLFSTKDTTMIIKIDNLLPEKKYYIGIRIYFSSWSSCWSETLAVIETSPKKD